MVDPILSTSSAVQMYHHLTSGSIVIRPAIAVGNSRSIWEKPVPYVRPVSRITMTATSSKVSHTEQGTIIFPNVLQGHKTVVLVCCTIE